MANEATERFKPHRRISGGIYKETPDEVSDGEPVSLLTDSIGRLNLACTPFDPPSNSEGQAVAFSAVSARSTVLVIGARYWIWSTAAAWIKFGDSTVTAAAGDFPLPPGAVTEYTAASGRDYISALQISSTGTLYIGRAA